ncbi:MAG: cytochrome P450 [Porticoccaceae bacterium]
MQSQAAHDVNLASLPPLGDGLLAETNRLRDHDPIFWSEESQCWLVSGHEAVTEGFSGSLPLSSEFFPESIYAIMPKEELDARCPNSVKYMSLISTNRDGAAHARMRRLLIKAFNPKLVESLRPYVRERVAYLLDIAEQRRDMEFHEEISRMLPGAVILRLLGMDESYLARLKGWADGVAAALIAYAPEPECMYRLEDVVNDMLEVFHREIEDRKRNPRNDLITYMVEASEDGDKLTQDEMLGSLIQMIIAGHDTTSNSLSFGVRAMAKYPQAWEAWRANPEKSVEYAIELMRYIAMSASMPRIVAEDFDWHGKHLKKGEFVILLIAGGNRDPLVYDNPENLDFNHRNDRALTFGPGMHHCIGHLLAKLQLGEFFKALVQRFDSVEVLEEPQFTTGINFRSLEALQVRFHPCGG